MSQGPEPEWKRALRDIKELLDEGIIDEGEFKAKKTEILAAAGTPSAGAAAAKQDGPRTVL